MYYKKRNSNTSVSFVAGFNQPESIRKRGQLHRVRQSLQSVWNGDGRNGELGQQPITERKCNRYEMLINVSETKDSLCQKPRRETATPHECVRRNILRGWGLP